MSELHDSPAYLHGFSSVEQARLMKQARLLENTIFSHIDYTGARRLLEVGSGVGAQTEILLRRFPDVHVSCVDLSELQLPVSYTHLDVYKRQGHYRLDSVQTHHIRRFIAQMHARGLGGRSLARRLSAWRGFYRWLGLRGEMLVNPVEGIRAPKSPKALPKLLSPD